MGLYGHQGTVKVRCPRCGADLGTYVGIAFRTALCVACQKLQVTDAEVLEQAQQANQPARQERPDDTTVAKVELTPTPTTKLPEDPFNVLANKLMKRVRKKRI